MQFCVTHNQQNIFFSEPSSSKLWLGGLSNFNFSGNNWIRRKLCIFNEYIHIHLWRQNELICWLFLKLFLQFSKPLYVYFYDLRTFSSAPGMVHTSHKLCPSPHFLADQLILSQPGGHIIPTQYYVPPLIFGPCDGPDLWRPFRIY